MKAHWLKMAVIGAALALGYGSYILTKTPDNIVEQTAEAVLRTQGVDIDLSPEKESDGR